ncbi:MAG: thermosome subunit alpha [Haloferacaceae archaeon]
MSQSGDQQRMRAGGQPVFVLSEDAERTQGEDAQQANVAAGEAVAEAVRTTLGPNGMDKMLVSDGDVVVTNDGATILDEMDVEHPAADMIVDVATSQEEEVGDGTTTAAVLTGELLSQAEELLDNDVHPTAVVEGYGRARDIALRTIADARLPDDPDDEVLRQAAESAMTGKGTGDAPADRLAAAVVDAVRRVDGDGDDVQVTARAGRSSTATEVFGGIAVDDELEHEDVPRRYEDATVAVLDQALEQPEANVDFEYDITDTGQVGDATAGEQARLDRYVDLLVDHGVDVVYSSEEVEDYVAARLAEHDVAAVSNVRDKEMPAFARAVGAGRITNLEEADAEDFGHADVVRRERFDDEEELTFFENDDAGLVTLFVRGGTGYVVDELERAVQDGVDAVVEALDGGVVPGAAATEVAVASALRDEAAGVEGRQQLAVEAFAEAVETIPRTIAQNAGMDPIDALVDLRSANETGSAGVLGVGTEARIGDPASAGVVDPTTVKRGAVQAAVEAATMIVRIDDVISAD